MDPAPHIEFLTPKPSNNTYYNINNSDLYKYIEKIINQDELERLKSEFEKDNLAAKSEDELLKIFSAKSLRFLVITDKLGSNLNSEESRKIDWVIKRVWRLKLDEISKHYKDIFGNDENTSPENLFLKFLNLEDAGLNKFKLKELFDTQSLFCEILGEKYALSGEDKCKLSDSLFSNYSRIFNIENLEDLKDDVASFSQKDLRKILKNLLNNFSKLLNKKVPNLELLLTIRSLYNVAKCCSAMVAGEMYGVLIIPMINMGKNTFTENFELFKQKRKEFAKALDKESVTISLNGGTTMMDLFNLNSSNPCLNSKEVRKIDFSNYIKANP